MKEAVIHDISRTISAGALLYPGDPPLEAESILSIDAGDPCNLTRLGWLTHFLTHVDVPRHFFDAGESADCVSLHKFFGECLVVEVAEEVVSAHHVPTPSEVAGKCLLFKTSNSSRWEPSRFLEDHVYLSIEAASRCVEAGAKLVGVDYLSPDRYGDESYPVHKALLGAGIPILEGIDLSDVAPGTYNLFALPLKIAGGDGSPVRAVLIGNRDLPSTPPNA